MLTIFSIVAGFLIGVISGLIGIGGGTILVPLFIYGFRMNMVTAVGTALAVIAPVSLVGAFSHHLKGHVDLVPVLFVAAAAAIGIYISGQLIHLVPEPVLRKFFAFFLIAIAVKMLLK